MPAAEYLDLEAARNRVQDPPSPQRHCDCFSSSSLSHHWRCCPAEPKACTAESRLCSAGSTRIVTTVGAVLVLLYVLCSIYDIMLRRAVSLDAANDRSVLGWEALGFTL